MENKIERLKRIADENEWDSQISTKIPDDGPIEWNLYCLRGQESMRVIFIDKSFLEATYIYGETKSMPARPGAVVAILTGTPDLKKLQVTINESNFEEHRLVPWDSDETSPAVEIMIGVLDRKITWIRKIDGQQCSSYIDREKNLGKEHFKLKMNEKTGMRYLQWIDLEGYHAVSIDRIIQVT